MAKGDLHSLRLGGGRGLHSLTVSLTCPVWSMQERERERVDPALQFFFWPQLSILLSLFAPQAPQKLEGKSSTETTMVKYFIPGAYKKNVQFSIYC